MFATNSSCGRRGRFVGTPTTNASSGSATGTHLTRPRLPFRCYSLRLRSFVPFSNSIEQDTSVARIKRLKNRKVNVVQKMDLNKKKPTDYTEMAYREAVSKLKYLLAETYAPRVISTKPPYIKSVYQSSNPKINESGEDTDDRSMVSDCSRSKDFRSYLPPTNNIHSSKACSNLALSTVDMRSVPPELTSFIERQEEYIEQLERESQYCRNELSNLLSKVREVVAENEELHIKNKSGFFKCALEEHQKNLKDDCEYNKRTSPDTSTFESKQKREQRSLECPSIVLESRISELEAQLTQARLELRKTQEENQANIKRLSESYTSSGGPGVKDQLEHALRAKYELEMKVEELQKTLSTIRDKESDATQKAKRSHDLVQQMEFEKNQYEMEIRRLKDELERQHEKLREATQELNRRLAEERQQVERRYSQQVEQLTADVATHWDAASKSQLESEKQRRELMDLRRELAQKQTFIDNLKKELQSKISSLQSELNQALTEKDVAEQEVLAAKMANERSERMARQEQSRLQSEINSYKQRLERADIDVVHCRRENLRLLEQIASLEKEISMNKIIRQEEDQAKSKGEGDKEITSMIMDMETKHAATVAGLEEALSNQATLVSQLTAECQSLTQRLEANNLRHKEEMANLQSNIEYLSNKIQGTIDNQKVESTADVNAGDSAIYNYNTNATADLNHTQQVLNPNNLSGHQIANEEYDTGQQQVSPYQNIYEKTDATFEEYKSSDYNGLKDNSKEDVQASVGYETHEDHNVEQEYINNIKDSEPYNKEEEYNQYEQYDQTMYDGQYIADDQLNPAELHDNSQYATEDSQNPPDAITSDREFTQ